MVGDGEKLLWLEFWPVTITARNGRWSGKALSEWDKPTLK